MDRINLGQWPTLAGRLNQPITSELEALEQLEKSVPLSVYGKTTLMRERKKLERRLKKK